MACEMQGMQLGSYLGWMTRGGHSEKNQSVTHFFPKRGRYGTFVNLMLYLALSVPNLSHFFSILNPKKWYLGQKKIPKVFPGARPGGTPPTPAPKSASHFWKKKPVSHPPGRGGLPSGLSRGMIGDMVCQKKMPQTMKRWALWNELWMALSHGKIPSTP